MTHWAPADRPVVPGIEVVREGRVEAFLHARPALSSKAIEWGGLAVEDYHVPACVIPHHEHVHDFLHVVLSGSVLLALTTDLDAGSPAGRLYGESLANALAVYLLSRYAVRRRLPMVPKGGLPRCRLKRVLDYIGENLAEDVSLSDLAELAGMSAHHFAELFKRSMRCTPHRYVLQERVERAKTALRDPRCSVLDAAAVSGFPNPSHFARVFRRFVGVSPSQFQSDQTSLLRVTQRRDLKTRTTP